MFFRSFFARFERMEKKVSALNDKIDSLKQDLGALSGNVTRVLADLRAAVAASAAKDDPDVTAAVSALDELDIGIKGLNDAIVSADPAPAADQEPEAPAA